MSLRRRIELYQTTIRDNPEILPNNPYEISRTYAQLEMKRRPVLTSTSRAYVDPDMPSLFESGHILLSLFGVPVESSNVVDCRMTITHDGSYHQSIPNRTTTTISSPDGVLSSPVVVYDLQGRQNKYTDSKLKLVHLKAVALVFNSYIPMLKVNHVLSEREILEDRLTDPKLRMKDARRGELEQVLKNTTL